MWRAADGAPLARRIADGLAERAILLQYAAGGRQARDGRGCCPRLDRPPLGPLILAAASWRGSSSEMLALASTLNLKLSRALRLKRVRVFCELLSIVYRLAAERPPHHLTAKSRAKTARGPRGRRLFYSPPGTAAGAPAPAPRGSRWQMRTRARASRSRPARGQGGEGATAGGAGAWRAVSGGPRPRTRRVGETAGSGSRARPGGGERREWREGDYTIKPTNVHDFLGNAENLFLLNQLCSSTGHGPWGYHGAWGQSVHG